MIREDLLIPHEPVTTDTEAQAADRLLLHQLLARHDWHYERADNIGDYGAGERSWNRITALASQVPGGKRLLSQQQKRIWG